MDKDRIDASIGLDFTLELLRRYRESGLLQATLERIPGMSGACEVSLAVVQGKIVACQGRDRYGYIFPLDLQMLLQLDQNRGPFEWSLLPLPEGTNTPIPPPSPIPYIIAALNLDDLVSWTATQKQTLFDLYRLIDGRKTIEQLKQESVLPPDRVEEGLRILIALNVVHIA